MEFGSAVPLAEALFVGGFETTTATLSNAVWTLLRNPSEMTRVREDKTAREVLADEVLRYCSSVMLLYRIASAPVSLPSGARVQTGEPIIMLLTPANRDTDYFEDPETFRAIPRNHAAIAFG